MQSLSEITPHRQDDSGFRKRLTSFAQTISTRSCDKCGQPVLSSNSALIFEFINSLGEDWVDFFAQNRHLQPVVGTNNVVSCKGSPSRWAMISGLPDPRPEYADYERDTVAYQIWQVMQTLAEDSLLPDSTPTSS